MRWQQSAYVGDFLGAFRNFRRVSARKTGLEPLSGDLRQSPRGLSQAFCLWRFDFVSQLQTGPLFVRHGALARGDLSLSGTLLAWSGIGHAATPNTLGCMTSAGLDCVGDRPISTRKGRSILPGAAVQCTAVLNGFVSFLKAVSNTVPYR